MVKPNDFMLKSDRELLAARFEEERLVWERAHRHGLVGFVLVRWVLRVGLPVFLLELFHRGYLDAGTLHHSEALRTVAYMALLCVVIPSGIGFWNWHRNEKRFRGKVL